MDLHEKYRLTRVINARGTYTPLGASRSPESVRQAVSEALGQFFVIGELQSRVSQAVAELTGAEAAMVTHCTSAAITLSIAAAIAGEVADGVESLPVTDGMPDRVVIPASQVIDYGHTILTDIRLAGGSPVIAGGQTANPIHEIETLLDHEETACLLLVSSRLTHGAPLNLKKAVAAAHRKGVPAIIDAAAQNLRLADLLATGADLVLVSAQKTLGGPTAGLIIGRKSLVQACRAHENGVGRAMKASKEALIGVLAALEARSHFDITTWQREQEEKVNWFIAQAGKIAGLAASPEPDPTGLPFSRVTLKVSQEHRLAPAPALARALRQGNPAIWVDDSAAWDTLLLDLVALEQQELVQIIERLSFLS